tara:strand:- start:1538 stop:2197 length:660 start_codon:yes stop_codon:yes gene_type:complete
MKAAVWIRISDDRSDSENQAFELEQFADRRQLEIVKRYELEGISAWKPSTLDSRIQAAYQDARRREYDVLLVWALDRLSRRGALHLATIMDTFSRYGVAVWSIQEPWTEVPTEVQPILISIVGWFAEQESRRHSERTRAGQARARESGGSAGGRAQVQKHVDLELVRRLKAQGKGWRTVQVEHPRTVPTRQGGMKRPSVTTIRNAWEAGNHDPESSIES